MGTFLEILMREAGLSRIWTRHEEKSFRNAAFAVMPERCNARLETGFGRE